MIKLTKKQAEVVETLMKLEKEHNCAIYLRYDRLSKKIRPIKIDSIEGDIVNVTTFPVICTHGVALAMESKGIVVPEVAYGETTLCRLNNKLAA